MDRKMIFDIPLAELDLSPRVYRCLTGREEMSTIQDLLDYIADPEVKLIDMTNIGSAQVKEISEKLTAYMKWLKTQLVAA
jgi:DNA-directed RNA polymerase alpha subunit